MLPLAARQRRTRQQVGHAHDRVDGGTDLVAHVREEPALRVACRFGLRLLVARLAQAGALRVDRAHVAVGAHGAGGRGDEPGAGHLRLREVVVDVVRGDDFQIGRPSGLARAQHDADEGIPELRPDPAGEREPGLVRLHHDVEDHQRGLRVRREPRPGLLRRAAGLQVDRGPVDPEPFEREAGHPEDIHFVVYDQDPPWRRRRDGAFRLRFGGEQKVVVIHRRSASRGVVP